QQYTQLIAAPSEQLKRQEFIVVIDALDECEDKVMTIKAIRALYNSIPASLRFLVTSRPEQHMSLDKDVTRVLSLHDIEESILNRDIQHYLITALRKLPSDSIYSDTIQFPPNWPSEAAVDTLTRRAGKLFIYASMMYEYIAAHDENPQRRLHDLL
ncbi:hypothetical protein PLICRDRAFT_65065, partial [Plicaturopsis crispa FD-325 SS-3]